MAKLGVWCSLMIAPAVAGCSTARAAPATRPVVAASPQDDGATAKAQGGRGGEAHAAALEQLATAPVSVRPDKQSAVLVPLPDAGHWTRVRFLTVKSLLGFRYGKEHHAIVAGFVVHVDDNSVQGACGATFERWAAPMLEAFEVELAHEPPQAFAWSSSPPPRRGPSTPATVSIVEVDALRASTATLLARGSYEAAWAAYPAWGDKACLILGVAVPVRDEPARARAVRDRFVREVLPKVALSGREEPRERY